MTIISIGFSRPTAFDRFAEATWRGYRAASLVTRFQAPFMTRISSTFDSGAIEVVSITTDAKSRRLHAVVPFPRIGRP
jgi:hypothetical protein